MITELTDPTDNKLWTYYIDERLSKYLDKIKVGVQKRDKDFVLLVDGYEGSGKSTFAQHIGRYLDHSLHLDRICMTADEFKLAIINAKKGQCVIYDEAVTGLSSSDSISRIGKLLKSMMMQMRQKNLFVIVILPSVFELNKYAVLSRSRGLFHIYEKAGQRGFFVGYNRKDMRKLYIKGKKTNTYCVRSFFIGRFVGKYVINEEEYRLKKEEALFKLDEDTEKEEHKWKRQADFAFYIINKSGWSYDKIVEEAKKADVHISVGGLSSRVGKMSELAKKYRTQPSISI